MKKKKIFIICLALVVLVQSAISMPSIASIIEKGKVIFSKDSEANIVSNSSETINKNGEFELLNNVKTNNSHDKFREYKTDRYIISYKSEAGNKKLKDIIKGDIKSSYKPSRKQNIEVIILENKVKPDEFIKKVKEKEKNNSGFKYSADINYIQPDYEISSYSNDKYYNQQWGIINSYYEDKINNNENIDSDLENQNTKANNSDKESSTPYRIDANVTDVWKQTKGEGVIIAVLDTGIDITHEDLKSNIWSNSGEIPNNNIDDDNNGYVDDVYGWNFVDSTNQIESSNKMNDDWHGTSVAGIIAAQQNNDIGITGVAPKSNIMSLKVFNKGISYTSYIIAAIEYAEENGAKIVNCSWGTTENNPALKEAISKSAMLFIAAAGNGNFNIDITPVYPASYVMDNVISVASINKLGILSSFSNYGEKSVDIAAPGEEIISTYPGKNYYASSGTSMAAAFVSGEAALILSSNKNMNAANLKQRIIGCADKLSSLIGKISNGNKINCYNAVKNITNSEIIQIKAIDYNTYSNDQKSTNNSYELFSNNSWETKASYPNAMSYLSATALNGKIYASGGIFTNTSYVYDPAVNRWEQKANMTVERLEHSLVAANGKVYAISGYNQGHSIEEYDPSTNSWALKTNIPTPREGICAAVINNVIYVIGGYDQNMNRLNIVEAYHINTNTWSTKANMGSARVMAKASVIEGKIFVAGGWNENSMEMYDPTTNTWSYKASLLNNRPYLGLEAVNDKLYAFGGYNESYNFNETVEEYSYLTNTWRICSSMATPNAYFASAVVNNKIYKIGGIDSNYCAIDLVECYTPPLYNDDSIYDYGNDFSTAHLIQEEKDISGVINIPGDIDFFKFVATETKQYEIYTTGNIDSVGYIYDSNGNLLAVNDDYDISKYLYNFRIIINLQKGETYYVQVRAYNMYYTGPYTLKVSGGDQNQKLKYIYDENNRLKEIKQGGETIATYNYDKNGNLLSIQKSN